jgi:hypothetical protein
MFNDTCLIARKRKDQSPYMLDHESLRTSALEQILLMQQHKQAKAKQLCIQQGCEND